MGSDAVWRVQYFSFLAPEHHFQQVSSEVNVLATTKQKKIVARRRLPPDRPVPERLIFDSLRLQEVESTDDRRLLPPLVREMEIGSETWPLSLSYFF